MKSGNKYRRLVVSGLLLAVVLAGGFVLARRQPAGRRYAFSSEAADGGYVAMDAARQQRPERRETKYHRIQINSRPVVNEDTGICNLMIGNPAENEADVQVCLLIGETGEELFRSEVLRPGERKAYVTLEWLPEPGEHQLTADFYLLEPETQSIAGALEAEILLTVQPAGGGAIHSSVTE